MLVNYFPHLMYFKTEFLFMIVYQCPVGSGTLSEFKDLNNIILVWTCLNKSLRSPFNLTMMWNFISIGQWCEFSWNGWKFEERAQRMCNFPASPSTPPADKCCVIPTTNFRRKKLNWKSIHFESGRQSTHPAASIWLNSHFSTFSSGSLGAFRPKLQSRAKMGACVGLLQSGACL